MKIEIGFRLVLSGVVAVLLASPCAGSWRDANRNGTMEPYEDSTQPVAVRVDDLISRMTTAEKAGQLNLPYWAPRKDNSSVERLIASGGVGGLLICGGTNPARVNALQRLACEQARLGVPIFNGQDIIHGARGEEAPSNQLTRALIGFGGIAHSENHLAFKGSRLVGLCDPDAAHAAEGLSVAEANGWGKVKAYANFLKVLEDPGVDIVHICTPPHWHGVMSVMVARAGKDIWCEKPMTRTVGEGKRVAEYVKEKGRIFRINTWFRFKDRFYGFGTPVKPLRQVVENGLLGKGPIKCVFGAGQGFNWKFFWSGRLTLPEQPVPAGFDWDMWLGPAPWKPYNAHRTHGTFRGYWDYDSGGLGDMAQHYHDPLQYVLCKDEESPVRIDYVGPKQHPEVVGRFDRITLTYADGTEVIIDGDESLRKEPLLRGANGLCVFCVLETRHVLAQIIPDVV